MLLQLHGVSATLLNPAGPTGLKDSQRRLKNTGASVRTIHVITRWRHTKTANTLTRQGNPILEMLLLRTTTTVHDGYTARAEAWTLPWSSGAEDSIVSQELLTETLSAIKLSRHGWSVWKVCP